MLSVALVKQCLLITYHNMHWFFFSFFLFSPEKKSVSNSRITSFLQGWPFSDLRFAFTFPFFFHLICLVVEKKKLQVQSKKRDLIKGLSSLRTAPWKERELWFWFSLHRLQRVWGLVLCGRPCHLINCHLDICSKRK